MNNIFDVMDVVAPFLSKLLLLIGKVQNVVYIIFMSMYYVYGKKICMSHWLRFMPCRCQDPPQDES
jgi:hypothetical protein